MGVHAYLEAHGIPDGVLAVLRAALDASACHPDWIYAVGGLVGPSETWDPLLEEWQAAVDQWRIPRFHLSELPQMVGYGRTKMCEGYFRGLLRNCELHTVGAAVFTAHWERPDWGHDQSPRFDTAYKQSLWFALNCLAKHCEKHFPGQDVAILCDTDAPLEAMNAIFDKVQQEHPCLNHLAISNSFKRKELQAADLAAGLLRRSWVEISDNAKSKQPWGRLPKTKGKTSSSVWSRAQGFFLGRAMRLHEEGYHGEED